MHHRPGVLSSTVFLMAGIFAGVICEQLYQFRPRTAVVTAVVVLLPSPIWLVRIQTRVPEWLEALVMLHGVLISVLVAIALATLAVFAIIIAIA